jgi:glucans biosynthesis protein C
MENDAALARGNASGGTRRFEYLDNLRSFVIFLVVVMHSNVTYSGYGGWYYKETDPSSLDFPSRILFGLYGNFTQAWFMGTMFFLAAFFAARSLAKRGPAAFIKERLFRLGLPLLIYMLIVEPFIDIVIMGYAPSPGPRGAGTAYREYLSSFRWTYGTGPLWFAEILLAASLLYAAWRRLRPARKSPASAPGSMMIVLFILATSLAAFSIRLFIPVGKSVANLLLGYFASYVALFLLGVRAGERGWLPTFPDKLGLRWFRLVLCVAPTLLGTLAIGGGSIRGGELMSGGLNWQSFAFAFWESFVAMGFSLGIIAFFRRYLDYGNAFTRLLAANSFGVYMFHAPVLVAISLSLKDWIAPPLVKHAAVAPLAIAATLALSCLLRRLPGLRTLLK